MLSKTKINKRKLRKRNPEIVETIELANKKNLLKLGMEISAPRKIHKSVNLSDLNKINDKEITIVGKVLGKGDINKKIKVVALGFSKQAREKLEKAGCEIKTIREELK